MRGGVHEFMVQTAGEIGAITGDGAALMGVVVWWKLLAVLLVGGWLQGAAGRAGGRQRDFVARRASMVFVSLAVPSHIRPLNHMASELIGRGYRVSFAIPEEGRKMVNTGITVVSSGPSRFRRGAQHLCSASCPESTAFRGILTSFNEVLLPSVMPMFKSLKPSIKQSSRISWSSILQRLRVMLAEEYDILNVLNNPSLLFSPGESSALIPAWGSGLGHRCP